jgi:di/tricarboxylate transporter
MADQLIVFATLLITLFLFIWGKWRYDIVSILALISVSLTGIVPIGDAFAGFGHPAVITVAAVLIISKSIFNSGLAEIASKWFEKLGKNVFLQVLVLTGAVTLLSGFMNNIGALALLLPVALQIARKSGNPPSLLLMPLAFGSLLGGLMTMIGTPPNIIVAMYRAEAVGAQFRMFDYTPVGAGVAIAGVAFIALIGWRLLPHRKGKTSSEDLFHIEDYITEVRLLPDSPLIDNRIRGMKLPPGVDVNIIGIVRNNRKLVARSGYEKLRKGDKLIVEADSESLKAFIDWGKLKLVGSKTIDREKLGSDEIAVMEAVIMETSPMIKNTAIDLNLRNRFGINLLAISRKGERIIEQLGKIRFAPGDVLLLNGPVDMIHQILRELQCLPLAERNLRIGTERRVIIAGSIFGTAILVSAVGLIPVQLSFVMAAALMVLVKLISLRELYESIDWPIIILLGAMIPVGQALEISGGAETLASQLLLISGQMPPVATLTLLLIATMFLSDIINNAAAAVLMSPIAVNLAYALGASVDPFLMCVALGASCAFLTPIGHQSNTLVMGPGGYHFGDYWKLGLPLEVVILIVGVPLIVIFWPLGV